MTNAPRKSPAESSSLCSAGGLRRVCTALRSAQLGLWKAMCVYNSGTDLKLPLEFRNSKRPQSEAVDASRVKMKIIRSQAFSGAAH